MSVNSCDNGHKYDLWVLSEDASMASRECMNCGFVEVVPATKHILEQVKKQVDSKKLLDNFFTLTIIISIIFLSIDYLIIKRFIEIVNLL